MPGTGCEITCKEGYKPAPNRPTKIYCHDTSEHFFEWDIFASAWDNYEDCDGDYGFNCDEYPACMPDV